MESQASRLRVAIGRAPALLLEALLGLQLAQQQVQQEASWQLPKALRTQPAPGWRQAL
jgi:hypothetical protein